MESSHKTWLLYTVQEATVLDTELIQWTSSKLGKECIKAVYCHPAYLIYMHVGLDDSQAGIKTAGRSINNFRPVDDTINGRKQRETKEPPDEGERGE